VRRLLPLILLVLIPVPSAALADGCPLPCSGQNSSPPGTKLVYVQPEGPGGALLAYSTASRLPVFELPPGMSSADGRVYYSPMLSKRGTRVWRYDVASGAKAGSRLVGGSWDLQAVSPSGERVALVKLGGGRTTVQVFHFRQNRVTHVLRLRGNIEVEAISRDGKQLFLIEHLRNRRYNVRQYDLTRERLIANPLRAAGVKIMAGYAWSGVASPDGRWLLTLYLSTARRSAFVHSLDLEHSKPVCIGLPSAGAFRQLKQYSLTLDPQGETLYAANPTLGVISEIDLEGARIYRTKRFARSSPGIAERAATLSTISRNGRTLYFSAGRDLWAYDSAYGLVRGPYRTGGKIVGVGYGAQDRRVFVVRADGRMLAFEAATGERMP